MTGTHLEIVSHNVLWYKHSFRMDCKYTHSNLSVNTVF